MANGRYNTPDLSTESDAIVEANVDNIEVEYYNTGVGDTVKNKRSAFRRLMELLPFTNGLRLSGTRIAMQEKTSSSISATGWYKVAETDTTAFDPYSGFISIADKAGRNSGMTAHFSGSGSGQAAASRSIEKLSEYSYNSGDVVVDGIRLGVSTVSGSGAIIEVHLTIPSSTATLGIQLFGNLARAGTGMELITPVASDGLLPDGVTAATFIEAGAEFSLDFGSTGRRFVPNVKCAYSSNDSLRVTVLWPGIPKQGTGLTITAPSTAMQFIDGSGANTTLGSHTISNFAIDGNIVLFNINQTGIGSGLNVGGINMLANGSGGKLTIT